MKEYYRNREFICLEEITNYPGKKDAVGFFKDLCIETTHALNDYSKHQERYEHGFEMREQPVKTYLTISLGKITKNNVIQEYSIERNCFHKKDKNKTNTGRLDYWASIEKTAFLIEVKHGWVRYYKKNVFKFYSELMDKMDEANKQIDKIIDKKNLHDEKKRLFGLSLIVAPIYGRNVKFETMHFSSENLDYYWKQCKNIGANIVGIWRLSNDYNQNVDFTDNIYGVFFIGKLKKITKK